MVTLLPFENAQDSIEIPFPVPALLTLRSAGDMRREGTARSRYYEDAGIIAEHVHIGEQVHSRNVAVVTGKGDTTSSIGEHLHLQTDGLVTDDDRTILAVTVADCMPIFLYDRQTGARGLLHSGWKGTGILANAVAAMEEAFSTRAADLVVTLGPCISSASYEVDSGRHQLFTSEWGPQAGLMVEGGYFLDLRAANREICRRIGIDVVNVIDHCTVQESKLGSFRRQGPDSYTLMLAVLG